MKTALLAALALVASACSKATTSDPEGFDVSKASDPALVQEPETRKATETRPMPEAKSTPAPSPAATETATFATGCYWCSEAVMQRLPGVVSVRSGFTGGDVANPSYEQVCEGDTGHAEAIEVVFDPSKITYETLLDWFWRMHDPTTLNRQGADEGTQYRSAIFVHSDAQRAAAEKSKKDAQSAFKDPIVTEITKAGPFYVAPAYHSDYYNQHTSQGYCRAVIAPKLHKLGLDKDGK